MRPRHCWAMGTDLCAMLVNVLQVAGVSLDRMIARRTEKQSIALVHYD